MKHTAIIRDTEAGNEKEDTKMAKLKTILTSGRSADKMEDIKEVTWKKLMMIPYDGPIELPEIIKAITDYTDFYTEDDEEEIIKSIENGYITFEADGIIIWGA